MRIALIAPPFISVPPQKYGGTELFVAVLANALHRGGHDVVVYANGDSRVDCELRWRYPHSRWPIVDASIAPLENLDHTAWALHDAAKSADVIHLNDAIGLPATMFVDRPCVLTLHHPHLPELSEFYACYPYIHYVAFLGRMAPCKGADRAIAAARRAGVKLKLAGEIQPVFREYWESQVLPHIDGRDVEYVGEADFACKNELLSRARACLFPIDWDEPFGLVMIESMACGTPVLALPGGSVAEVVRDGISGWVCRDVDDMADRIASLEVPPASCRSWVEREFTVDRMTARYVDLYRRLSDATRAESARVALTTS